MLLSHGAIGRSSLCFQIHIGGLRGQMRYFVISYDFSPYIILFIVAYKPRLPVRRAASWCKVVERHAYVWWLVGLNMWPSLFLQCKYIYSYSPLQESTKQAYESGLADGEGLAKQHEVHSITQFMGCIRISKYIVWRTDEARNLNVIHMCSFNRSCLSLWNISAMCVYIGLGVYICSLSGFDFEGFHGKEEHQHLAGAASTVARGF